MGQLKKLKKEKRKKKLGWYCWFRLIIDLDFVYRWEVYIKLDLGGGNLDLGEYGLICMGGCYLL